MPDVSPLANPATYLQYYKDAQARLQMLQAQQQNMLQLPIGGKDAKMGEGYITTPQGQPSLFANPQASQQAYDQTSNIRDSEIQDMQQRALQLAQLYKAAQTQKFQR